VCWSISSVVLRPALDQVDVLTSTALRICCGSLLIWVFAWRSGRVAQTRFSRSRVGTALAAGTLSAGSMFLYLVATQQAGVARAAMLSATSPLYAIPLSALVLGEHVTPRMAAGTLLVIGGVALLVGA
jgi:drug/metabolite transporter (DMT)-like permease